MSRAATRCTPRRSDRGRSEEPDQGRQVVFPDRRLRVRPRPVSCVFRSWSRTAGSTSATTWCRPTLDYSAYILKIRNAKPEFVYINLAGVDQTTFLKQYKEYGLDYPIAGGVMDTRPFWAAGIDSLSGHWQSLWYHGLDTEPPKRSPKSSSSERQAAREPGLGRLRRDEDPAQGDRRDRRHRQQGDRRVSREGPRVRHPERPSRQVPQLGPPAAAGDVRGQGQGARPGPRTSGTSSSWSSRSPARIRISR